MRRSVRTLPLDLPQVPRADPVLSDPGTARGRFGARMKTAVGIKLALVVATQVIARPLMLLGRSESWLAALAQLTAFVMSDGLTGGLSVLALKTQVSDDSAVGVFLITLLQGAFIAAQLAVLSLQPRLITSWKRVLHRRVLPRTFLRRYEFNAYLCGNMHSLGTTNSIRARRELTCKVIICADKGAR